MKTKDKKDLSWKFLFWVAVITLIITLLGFATSYKLGETVDWKESCFVGQTGNLTPCTSNATCQLDLTSPKNILLLINVSMSRIASSSQFNYTISQDNLTIVGIYETEVRCRDPVHNLQGFNKDTFEIKSSAVDIDVSDAIIYSLLFLSIGAIFFLTLSGYQKLEWKNGTNMNGITIISYQKYGKLFLLSVLYLEILVFLFVSWNTAENLLFIDSLSRVFYAFFYGWALFGILSFFLGAYFLFIMMITDKRIRKAIKGGAQMFR